MDNAVFGAFERFCKDALTGHFVLRGGVHIPTSNYLMPAVYTPRLALFYLRSEPVLSRIPSAFVFAALMGGSEDCILQMQKEVFDATRTFLDGA